MRTTGSAIALESPADLQQNDFGFTVGGPVWIPKFYHGQNKTFFFFSYEGNNGDFSKWVIAAGQRIPIYDPTTSGDQRRWLGDAAAFNSASLQALGAFQQSGNLHGTQVRTKSIGFRAISATMIGNRTITICGSIPTSCGSVGIGR